MTVPFTQICLTSPEKVVTLKFNVKTFKLQHVVAVHTPFNTQVSFFLRGKSVHTFPWETNNITTMYNYDSIEITNMKNTFHANNNHMMALVNGFIITPPGCVSLSGSDPLVWKDTQTLIICGKPGKDSIDLSNVNMDKYGIDFRDFSNGISFITTGCMATVTAYATNNFEGLSLTVPANKAVGTQL